MAGSLGRGRLFGAAALLVVAGLVAFLLARPSAVTIATVTTRDLAPAIQGVGTVEAKRVVSVSSKITARIVAVLVDQGDTIRAGQLVARLDDAQLRADVERAEATARATEAQLRDLLAGARAEEIDQLQARAASAGATRLLAERELQRVRELSARELIAAQDLDRARQAFEVATAQERDTSRAVELARQGNRTELIHAARAQLRSAESALVFAREKLADTRIASPLDGYVVSRALEAGSVVNPGVAIFKVAAPQTAWATVYVDARETAALAVGDPADITLRSLPGRPFPGRVARIQREGDRVTEQLAIDVTFTERPSRLTLGEQVEIAIRPPVRPRAIALPLAAVVRRPDGMGTLVVDGGRLRFRALRLGAVDPAGWVEALDGVRPGDAVVLAPGRLADAANDGRRVRATPAP